MEETLLNLDAINKKIELFKTSLSLQSLPDPGEPLWAGVDLGTANIVTAVVNKKGTPVAGILTRSNSTVRDGLVFDYMGTMTILRNQVKTLTEKGIRIQNASAAYPPGTIGRNRDSFGHILNGAGLDVSELIDEPSAAALALGIEDGCVVDIGGGTTGISILEGGSVVYTGDEPTGGHHLDLVIAGNLGIEIDAAEKMKNDSKHQDTLYPVVMPVFEKMASIVRDHIKNHHPKVIYLVGGTSSFPGADAIMSRETGLPVILPCHPLLVAPLGTALNAANLSAQKKVISNG
jgi:ethanolamine utilization protein EutJ